MDHRWLEELSDDAIRAVVGSATYERGLGYARADMVQELSRGGGGTLFASVRGSGRQSYATLVTGPAESGAGRAPFSGRCTCPVGVDCKHVVAAVLTARDAAGPGGARQRSGPARTWEGPLAEIVSAGARADPSSLPLALQLEVVATPPPAGRRFGAATPATAARRIRIQPVARGKSGNWVRSAVSWRDVGFGCAPPHTDRAHVDALSEVFFAHQARTRAGYFGGDRPIHLDELGQGLWPLLERLAEAGVELVLRKPAGGPVLLSAQPARVSLDLRREGADGATVMEPVVTLDGDTVPASAVSFVGSPAHGLFAEAEGEESKALVRGAGLLLARLEAPLSEQVSHLLRDERRLEIPPGDLPRFLHVYYPALRQALPMASSDRTVSLPEIEPPRLALTVSYGPDHQADLRWGFDYRVGEDVVRVPLGPAGDEGAGELAPACVRDARAEQALTDAVDLPGRLPQLWTGGGRGRALRGRVRLTGLDTAVFSEDVLPLLRAHDDLVLEVVGTPPAYRFTEAEPLITVSATEEHGESDWFDLGVTVSIDGERIPFNPLFVALARGERHLLLDSGTWFSIERPELDQLRHLIEEARALQDRESEGLRITPYQAGLWEELVALGVVESQSRRWDRTVRGLLGVDDLPPPPVPAALDADLRPYQLEGYQWLSFLWDHRLGGVLADDMGLGKTVQTLALMCRAFEGDQQPAPFLVVAPTSVVSNWAHEAARFAPHLSVATVTETERRRGSPLAQEVGDAQVVVTSYALFRIDHASYAALPWGGLVLDEAQFVKNHQGKTYQCARRLAAPFKLAITGTPLENNLMELWSLLSIVAPGLFPSPQRFAEVYAKPIERGGDPDRLATLRRRVRPLMRRRTKEQVAAELPAKQEQVLEVELNPRHQRIYQTHLQRERQKILGLIEDMDKNRFAIFRSITLLRQLALAPALVDEKYSGVRSSKVDAFFEQLEEVIGEGHRALVFSQFTGFLRTVRDRLDAEGVAYCYLDGRTRNRGRQIEEFKGGDAPVFLISLKAGGFGLNLTEADYCFVLDPWWNPAVEAQAVDRTHRIGQDKQVMVYRLVSTGTIEEKVMELKARKLGLFTQVMGDDALLSAPLTPDDIVGLLG